MTEKRNESEKLTDEMVNSIEDIVQRMYERSKDERSFLIALLVYTRNLLQYGEDFLYRKKLGIE